MGVPPCTGLPAHVSLQLVLDKVAAMHAQEVLYKMILASASGPRPSLGGADAVQE